MGTSEGSRAGEERNRLLAAVPHADRTAIEAELRVVDHTEGEALHEPRDAVEHVWFPLSGVFSLVTVMQDGARAEVAAVGNEGFVGVPVFLGAPWAAWRAFCQAPGRTARMPAATFRCLSDSMASLRSVLQRYTQSLLNQMAQTAACNRLHPLEQRCARWMLMTRQRVGAETFPLRQEFLSQMLGVRPPAAAAAAGALREAGIITYAGGRVTVLDSRRLEAAACECHGVILDDYERLIGNGQPRRWV